MRKSWTIAAISAAAILLIGIAWFFLRPRPEREIVLATYESKFRCTIYYTPREAAFTREQGFDVSEETRPGLQNRKFSKDFLKAVELEGFGRLKEPFRGKSYIRHLRGTWAYASQPVDTQDRPLVAKQSCAAATGQDLLSRSTKFRIRLGQARDFEKHQWILCDTGSELEHWQLDLYWGEGDPAGPGKRLTRPKDAPAELAAATVLVVK